MIVFIYKPQLSASYMPLGLIQHVVDRIELWCSYTDTNLDFIFLPWLCNLYPGVVMQPTAPLHVSYYFND